MRKFADKEQRTKNNLANGSNTEANLILCGYWGSGPIREETVLQRGG